MIQGGDPSGTGSAVPDTFSKRFTDLKFDKGGI
jgi:hypothetical protein